MNGFLNIDKPAGRTSHDVVAKVRRIFRTKRAGHAGTLDPDAVGVLVVAVGQATRLLPHLPTEPKEYVARIAFGVATDTEDASGTVTETGDASLLTEAQLQAVLPRFVGEISQIPPMVSAVHHEGRRLYELAREGVTVERQPRTVTLFSLSAEDFTAGDRAEATLRVSCGGGTYIRTLCVDIGKALGLPAHMKSLIRNAVGAFRRESALSLEALEAQGENALLAPEQALGLPLREINDGEAQRVLQGQAISNDSPPETVPAATEATVALIHRERLLALAHYTKGEVKPFKVFPPAE
ncbi:MAG: tRNA pseudouridine(55) synthase TruB [Armatimonadaceae bacterium]